LKRLGDKRFRCLSPYFSVILASKCAGTFEQAWDLKHPSQKPQDDCVSPEHPSWRHTSGAKKSKVDGAKGVGAAMMDGAVGVLVAAGGDWVAGGEVGVR